MAQEDMAGMGTAWFHPGAMACQTIFITGTDTGAGKTVLAALLVRHLRARGIRVAAFKPFVSGGRADARVLRAALGNSLTLDEINPWHFRAPLAPLLAARREGRAVGLAEVLAHARRLRANHEALVIEGAGGLLSPLGVGFNARDLIVALRARALIACPNRLGAVSQALLALAALPAVAASEAKVILISPPRSNDASRSNAALLAEFVGQSQVLTLPRIPTALRQGRAGELPAQIRRMLSVL